MLLPRFHPLIAIAASAVLAGCADEGSESRKGSTKARPPAFAACAACHSTEEGGRSGAGPNLHGIVGRRAASAAGFNYSRALRDSGIVWTEDTLDRYLQSPLETVPGSRMTMAVTDPTRRRAIIAYLAQAD